MALFNQKAHQRQPPRSLQGNLTGFAVILTATLSFLFVATSVAQQSANTATSQGRKVTLSDQLRAGLKATTKADKAFIDDVVIRVQQGKLPRRMVDGTMLWARERAARKSRTRALRPMVYFRPALTLRAKRIGVKL